MPRRKGLKERFKTWVLGTKAKEETYPDMESSPCQKCKIMTAYMDLTKRAVKLEVDALNTPISQTSPNMYEERPRYPGQVTIENRGP